MRASRPQKLLVIITIVSLLFPTYNQYDPNELGFDPLISPDDDILDHWGPIIYQEIPEDQSKIYLDQITSIDYDNDLDTSNNWDNLENHKFNLAATVYTWMKETDDSYYLGYGFYHPRDWTDSVFGLVHENDFEGVVLHIVKDESSTFGHLSSIVTIAHSDLLHYSQDISRDYVKLEDGKPVVYIESEGHGVYAHQLTQSDIDPNFIRYHPLSAQSNNNGSNYIIQEGYSLNSIEWLWDERENPDLFTNNGYFTSDMSGGCSSSTFVICQIETASPPWRWSQGQNFPGQLWYEPEAIFANY